MKIEVECYAGFKADQRPVRFRLGERWREVEAVIDQWYGPDDTYFKVRSGTESYILRLRANGEWTLEAYRANWPGGSSLIQSEYCLHIRF